VIIKAYKFRLYPTKDQEILLSKHFGSIRHVYNWALDFKTKYYKENKKNIHWMQLSTCAEFYEYRSNNSWLKEVNSQSIVSSIGNLDKAYKNFFEGRSSFPKFKNKRSTQSFQVPQHGKLDINNGKLLIPKFKGGIKCIFHREIPDGKHGTYTISKNPSGKYFVSILVHTEIKPTEMKTASNAIGVDFGLKTFITTSDGVQYNSPEFLKQSSKKLAKLQRKFSKSNGIKNKENNRIKVARLHEKVTNQRQDFLHKLSNELICKNQADTICIEDLNIAGMRKMWGRKISDLSWSEFTRQLEYKAEWYGKNLIKIGRFDPSSQICSNCGYRNHNLSLDDRKWTCPDCKEELDRDVNAAINIRDFGMNKYQLGQELTDVKPLEKKALARNREKSSETIFDELGKKKNVRNYVLKPTGSKVLW
jgi:putative transposase